MQPKAKAFYLPVIVLAQFMGTSVWFAGNVVINELATLSGTSGIANYTSFVQFGFIIGTFVFALLSIADRFKPSVIFLMSALLAALANSLLIFSASDLTMIGILRLVTGFFLAGIYPVGMKIAADIFPQRLGKALGFLVGALVLGTAFPYFLRTTGLHLPWKSILIVTSLLCLLGGLAVYLLIPTHSSGITNKYDPSKVVQVFKSKSFRAAAFGYFGHMWELYTFWTFISIFFERYNVRNATQWNIPLWSFLVIGSGCIGCILGGLIAQKKGSRQVAIYSLVISGCCCLLAPFSFGFPPELFIFFIMLWGVTVAADSPQLSTLIAQAAPNDYKGTALTTTTCLGFLLTIISIQLLKGVFPIGIQSIWLLVPGPVIGLIFLLKKQERSAY